PLKFSPQELAILCELMLRGAQTPGELRSRAARMAPIGDVSEVETALNQLAAREDGPFVVRLPREPGRRDSRYAQLFTGPVQTPASAEAEMPADDASAAPGATTYGVTDSRIERLESDVRQLRAELDSLKKQLGV